MDFAVLNVHGLVIGCASANSAQDAVRQWNRANVNSQEVATSADERVTIELCRSTSAGDRHTDPQVILRERVSRETADRLLADQSDLSQGFFRRPYHDRTGNDASS